MPELTIIVINKVYLEMWDLIKGFWGCFALVLSITHAAPAFSANIVAYDNPLSGRAYREILLEGEIVPGDLEKLKSLFGKRLVTGIRLMSKGGDVSEAMKISQFMNEKLVRALAPEGLRISGHVDELKTLPIECMGIAVFSYLKIEDPTNCVCFSSCALIWLTSPLRSGNFVGIHRAYFDRKYFAGLNSDEAQSKYAQLNETLDSFLLQHDVAPSLISKMKSVSSGDIYLLTQSEIDGLGEMRPYLEELIHARCGTFETEFQHGQALKRNYEEIVNLFNDLQNSTDSNLINEVGDQMLQAQRTYHAYLQTSPFDKCAAKQKLNMSAELQKLPLEQP